MNGCPHPEATTAGRVCLHLATPTDLDYVQRFTGAGLTYDLACTVCGRDSDSSACELTPVCQACFEAIEREGAWDGIVGTPEVRVAPVSGLRFHHETCELPEPTLDEASVVAIAALPHTGGAWLACTATGDLIALDPRDRSASMVTRVPLDVLDLRGNLTAREGKQWLRGPRCTLRVSLDGTLAAVADTYGSYGAVVDLVTGRVTMPLCRDEYHVDVSCFPLAFAEHLGRAVLIHGTAWNRLDVSDPRSGALLTPRGLTAHGRGEPRPPHDLDYFHGQLSVSPGGQHVVDNGWVWAPFGVVETWDLPQWLDDNVWESEDGASKRSILGRSYYWDGPLCWVDEHRLAVWGYGADDEWLIPAVQVFDARTARRERWFAGPKGTLTFDEFLFSSDPAAGTSAWDLATSERVAFDADLRPGGYHPESKQFVSILNCGVVKLSTLRRR